MTTGQMVLRKWITALAVCVAIFVEPCEIARASDQQMVADVSCVVVGMRMIQMAAPQQRAAGLMVATYYLGRLDGRAPDAVVRRLIEREAASMTVAAFRANATRCGKALTAKGQEIEKIAANLSSKEQSGTAKK
ncbi:MAG: hypothetical protein ACREV7_18365 [Steroidobacteraceae bacterium]